MFRIKRVGTFNIDFQTLRVLSQMFYRSLIAFATENGFHPRTGLVDFVMCKVAIRTSGFYIISCFLLSVGPGMA
jgi:hypothetical protein